MLGGVDLGEVDTEALARAVLSGSDCHPHPDGVELTHPSGVSLRVPPEGAEELADLAESLGLQGTAENIRGCIIRD